MKICTKIPEWTEKMDKISPGYYIPNISSIFYHLTCIVCIYLLAAGVSHAMTIAEEKEIAKEFLKTIQRVYPVINDPVIMEYINGLEEKLQSAAGIQPYDIHIHVIDEDTVNAFAGPAGHIFVFSGLIITMQNDDELAAIIAHELGHVTARHIPELIEQGKKTGALTMAGVIAGILMGLGGAPTLGTAVSLGSVAAGKSAMLAYTRQEELQADELARQYLQKAGFDIHGMLSALEKIRKQEWFSENEIPTYLRTHPATRERIARLASILDETKRIALKKSEAYERMHARILGIFGPEQTARSLFEATARKNPSDPWNHYGYALLLSRIGRPEAAQQEAEKALAIKPSDPYIKALFGKIEFSLGKTESAYAILKDIGMNTAAAADALATLAKIEMQKGNYQMAEKNLQKLMIKYPDLARPLFLLGRCYGEQGILDKAHYYLGKYFSALNDFKTAKKHFEMALSSAKDEDMIQKIKKAEKKFTD